MRMKYMDREATYNAQNARTTPTLILFFQLIYSLSTIKIGTMLKVQSVKQDNAEYPYKELI
jgi:hypothetical protein